MQCNNLLRSARDDRRTLRAAADYLIGQKGPARKAEKTTRVETRPRARGQGIEAMPVIELLRRLRLSGA